MTARFYFSEIAQWTRIVPAGEHRGTVAWDQLERRGFLKRIVPAPDMNHETGGAIASYASRPSFDYALPGGLNKPANQPHLENFFAAIRGEATLNCDARTAFLSEAPLYLIESAARNRQIIDFGPAQHAP